MAKFLRIFAKKRKRSGECENLIKSWKWGEKQNHSCTYINRSPPILASGYASHIISARIECTAWLQKYVSIKARQLAYLTNDLTDFDITVKLRMWASKWYVIRCCTGMASYPKLTISKLCDFSFAWPLDLQVAHVRWNQSSCGSCNFNLSNEP